VRSGDKAGVQRLMEKIDAGTYFEKKEDSDDETDDESSTEEEDEAEEYYECCESTQCAKTVSRPDEPLNKNPNNDDVESSDKDTKSGGRHGGKYTSKNVPYTRTGDSGTSVLLTGERRSKDDDAFEAMGTVDELCSVVGVVHAEITNVPDAPEEYAVLEEWLLDVMSRLFDIGSHVAKPRRITQDDDGDDEGESKPAFRADGVGNGFDIDNVQLLEEWIDHMTDELPELTSFILPTGSKVSAQLHVARTVCRRAERVVSPLVRMGVCDPNASKYLNRLSDFFFTAARWSNFCDGLDEVQYRRPIRGAKQRDRFNVNLRDEKKEN